MAIRSETVRVWAVAIALVLAVAVVFGRSAGFDFILFDDPMYVSQNPHLVEGLSPASVAWSLLSAGYAGNWHPLTWLSIALDIEVFGVEPAAHHAINVLVHAGAAVALLLALRRMLRRSPEHADDALWIAALVAALFALHPLRVESVVWVSQRKDVLGALFFMLGLAAWARYSERPGLGRYAIVESWLVLGLMSKPTVVTLPAVLLLLDVWPLGRLRSRRRFLALTAEKIPMLVPCAAVAVLTWIAQDRGGAIGTIPLAARIANSSSWAIGYIGKLVWPVGLAPFYPFPTGGTPPWEVLGAGLVLVAATILAWRARRRWPWLAVGWSWYLLTLLPVIGLLHVGMQAAADRYTYIPHIGLFLIAACSLHEIARSSLGLQRAAVFFGVAWLSILGALAWVQTGYWRDSETLFARAITVTRGNFLAEHGLGLAMEHRGLGALAEEHYEIALGIEPGYGPAHRDLGRMLIENGRIDEGVAHVLESSRLDPDDETTRLELGAAWLSAGRPEDAVIVFDEASRQNPKSFEAWNQLGVARDWLGETAAAAEGYRLATLVRPDRAEAWLNLGSALLRLGDPGGAADAYRRAVRLAPESADACMGLAVSSLQLGERDTAIEQHRRLLRLDPDRAVRLGTVLLEAEEGPSHTGRAR